MSTKPYIVEDGEQHVVLAPTPEDAVMIAGRDAHGMDMDSYTRSRQVACRELVRELSLDAEDVREALASYGKLEGVRVRIRPGDLAGREAGLVYSSAW